MGRTFERHGVQRAPSSHQPSIRKRPFLGKPDWTVSPHWLWLAQERKTGLCSLPDVAANDDAFRADRCPQTVLVERILELNKKKHSGKLAPSELGRVEREIS